MFNLALYPLVVPCINYGILAPFLVDKYRLDMAVLEVLEFPDPRLRTKAVPVGAVDASVMQIVADMFETLYQADAVGLAATQVNIHQRIIVIDVSENKKSPICLINPEILTREGTQYEYEGCLSLPGVYDRVERAAKITVRALDQFGKEQTITADELLSICVQHEMDHLQGILFADHLSKLKQERLRKKLMKFKKTEA